MFSKILNAKLKFPVCVSAAAADDLAIYVSQCS